MNMFDKARSIDGMMKMCGLSQAEMAKKLGVSQSYVANKLRLLRLDEKMQEDICRGGLSERHARALLRLTEARVRRTVLERVLAGRLTVAGTEALVDLYYEASAPDRLGRAAACERTATFLHSVSESVKILRSAGVDARHTTTHHGTKTYVTISIDEA